MFYSRYCAILIFVIFPALYIYESNSFQYLKIIWKSILVLYIFQNLFWQGLPFSIVNSSRFGTVMSIKLTKLPHSSCARFLCLQLMSWTVGCGFVSDRSVIKGTLLIEQSTFSSVSRPLEEISWFVSLFTLRACAINTVCLVTMGQKWRALYLQSKVRFR